MPIAADNAHPVRKHELALQQLEALCATLQPGDRLPSLSELVQRLGVSERAVMRALDELQRSGRVIRRQGSGTYLAEREPPPIVPPAVTDSRTVVAVRLPDNSYFDRCMDLLFRHTEAAGLSLIGRIIGPDTDLDSLVPAAGDRSIGFVLFRYGLAPLAKKIRAQGSRVVIVGAPPVDVTPEVPCVYGDHEQGGYLATKHLLDLGHRRIAYHAPNPDYRRAHRWVGHMRAVEDARRAGEMVEATVLSGEEVIAWRRDPQRAATYLRAPGAPTAIVCWNDHEAAQLLVSLHAAGVRVPEDVSVIGYDNLPEGQLVRPQLTTIDHSSEWQVRVAVDLLRRPTLPSASHTMVVIPTLIARGSTGPAPSTR